MTAGLGIFLIIVVMIPVTGAIAGWLVGGVMEGRSVWTNGALGILGAIVGSFLSGFLGLHFFGLIGIAIKATVGAVIALAMAHWFRKRQAG